MKMIKFAAFSAAMALALPTSASAAAFGFDLRGDFTVNGFNAPLVLTGNFDTSNGTAITKDGISGQSYALSNVVAIFGGQTYTVGSGLFGAVSNNGQFVGLGSDLNLVNSLIFTTSGTTATSTGFTAQLALINAPVTISGVTVNGASNVVGSIAAVPEPATWAMMIGGFGLVGGAMRRRNLSVKFA